MLQFPFKIKDKLEESAMILLFSQTISICISLQETMIPVFQKSKKQPVQEKDS